MRTDVEDNSKVFDLDILYIDKEADSLKPARKKARLVFNSAREEADVDYLHTYSPALRVQCFRIPLAIAACEGWRVRHSDQKGAYMHADLQPGPPLYVRMPYHMRQYRLVDGQQVEVLYRMEKVLYGQHVAGRRFSEKHRRWYLNNGFRASHAEPCLFACDHELGKCIVAAYVDDCCWVFENVRQWRSILLRCTSRPSVRTLKSAHGF